MKHHDISLDQALQHYLLADDPDGPPPPATGWLEGPLPHEYEAHVRGTKPFTAEQLAWVQAHPACQKMLVMFEQHYGVGKPEPNPIVLSPNPQGVLASEVAWDAQIARGRLDVVFPESAIAGALVFLQRVGQGLVRVSRLNALRRVSFSGLAAGEYRVVPWRLAESLRQFAMAGNFMRPERATVDLTHLGLERDFPEYNLHVSVKLLTFGEIRIAFTTTKPELADATVRFAFSTPDGIVLLSGAIKLQKHPAPPERWEGTWQYPLDFSGNCELTFALESD